MINDLFNLIDRYLPKPLVVAVLAITVVYFVIYYEYRYTVGDVFRDSKFRSLAIIIFAIALLFLVNKRPAPSVTEDMRPVLLIAKFVGDADGQFRTVFSAKIESKLDGTLGRTGTVQMVQSFIMDEESAKYTLKDYGATAILYAVSVSDIEDNQVVCLKVLMRDSRPLPRIPPIPIREPDEYINRLLLDIVGEVSKTEPESSQNPLLLRLRDLEKRLAQLESQIASQKTGPIFEKPFPSYRNRYAVVVGVDQFEASPTHVLRFSKSDAKQFGKLLQDFYGFNVSVLLDEKATKPFIISTIETQSKRSNEEDLFLFYFAGNGTEVSSAKTQSGKVASIVPYDFRWNSNHFSILELIDAVRKNPAKHKLLIIDSCQATSGVLASTSPPNLDADPSEPVIQIFGASRGDEVSYEGRNGGAFSQALIQVLRDTARQREDGLWMTDLHSRVQAIVAHGGFAQTTTLMRISGNGEIAFQPQNTR
jgi:hypothetical protein